MNFETSTHRKNWLLNPNDAVWKSTNERDLIASGIAFIYQILPKCGLGFDRKAFVTAAHYFHRYFAVENIESHPRPKVIALTCLFIAGKVEEVPWPKYTHGSLQNRGFRAEAILRAVNGEVTLDDLIETERDVLEALKFSLIVHHTRPRPAPGSDDELKETLMLMTTRACLTNSPEVLGAELTRFDISHLGEYYKLIQS